jgi:nitric oxide reductase subunit B
MCFATLFPLGLVFIAGGAVPALYIAYLAIRHTVKHVTLEEPDDILFTEVHEPEGVAPASGAEAAAARLT